VRLDGPGDGDGLSWACGGVSWGTGAQGHRRTGAQSGGTLPHRLAGERYDRLTGRYLEHAWADSPVEGYVRAATVIAGNVPVRGAPCTWPTAGAHGPLGQSSQRGVRLMMPEAAHQKLYGDDDGDY
jgi:hypothetical protein